MPVPEGYTEFTFKDTGRKVFIRKVSPLLIQEVQRSIVQPPAPVNTVKYGDEIRYEENLADPVYHQALQAYQAKVTEKLQRVMILRGVKVEFTDEIRQEIQELRDYWRTEMGSELDSDDKVVYVSFVCVGSTEDLMELMEAITRRSQPVDSAVQSALDTFKSPV